MATTASLEINIPSPEDRPAPAQDELKDQQAPAQAEESRPASDDPRQPILSNFRVLARTNVILRADQPNSGPNAG